MGKPIWINQGDHEARVLKVTGTQAFYSHEGDKNSALVDASIAPLIDLLNTKGYETWVSCSGLPQDHCDTRGWYGSGGSAYLGFDSTDIEILGPVLIAAGFTKITNRSAYIENNAVAVEKVWKKLYVLVQKMPNKK